MSIRFLWVYAMIKVVSLGSLNASTIRFKTCFLCAVLLSITACGSSNHKPDTSVHLAKADTVSSERMSKCLLPGQLRKIGSNFTYLTPRRTVQTSAVKCKMRGGELVS